MYGPLPAHRAEVTNPCTRDFLVDPPAVALAAGIQGCAAAAGRADVENELPRAQAVPVSPDDAALMAALPCVRGWLQSQVDAGMREAPMPQRPA